MLWKNIRETAISWGEGREGETLCVWLKAKLFKSTFRETEAAYFRTVLYRLHLSQLRKGFCQRDCQQSAGKWIWFLGLMAARKASHLVARNMRGMDMQRTPTISELSGHGLPCDGIKDLLRGKIIFNFAARKLSEKSTYCKGTEAVPGHRVKTMWVSTLTHLFFLFISKHLQLHVSQQKVGKPELQISQVFGQR